jgi:hypothetical protein
MYADPTSIRSNRVNLSLTDKERRALDAIADLNDTQSSVLARQLVLDFLRLHGVNSVPQAGQLTGSL